VRQTIRALTHHLTDAGAVCFCPFPFLSCTLLLPLFLLPRVGYCPAAIPVLCLLEYSSSFFVLRRKATSPFLPPILLTLIDTISHTTCFLPTFSLSCAPFCIPPSSCRPGAATSSANSPSERFATYFLSHISSFSPFLVTLFDTHYTHNTQPCLHPRPSSPLSPVRG
jgi:hypothetical protein